jgi:hypothetical protein
MENLIFSCITYVAYVCNYVRLSYKINIQKYFIYMYRVDTRFRATELFCIDLRLVASFGFLYFHKL